MEYRLLYEVGYKSNIDSNLDREHILFNGQPFDVLCEDAQDAAEWIAKSLVRLNENIHSGYYYINVLNWIREEV